MYGYDVRGEVFGSAGMLTMGDIRRTHLTTYGIEGVAAECVAYDQDLFHDAYVAGLADFTDSVRTGRTPSVTGEDARAALSTPSRPSSRSARGSRPHRRAQGPGVTAKGPTV
ncbi:hypothetical protein ABT173_11050 [Streptomyces sp. NPDC001795]|uniref:hypothetical protein n=1 Tax=Streptomyces sp. NPDC001795 TaxID=3154525 RepID=UPI0033230314